MAAVSIDELEDKVRDVLLHLTGPLPDKPQGYAFVAGLLVSDIVLQPLRRLASFF